VKISPLLRKLSQN